MKKRFSAFHLIYLIYIVVLLGLVLAAVLYVSSLLRRYEASQPETHVQQAVEQLAADAAEDGFWAKYGLSVSAPGKFEQGLDLQAAYLSLLTGGELDFVQDSAPAEDELIYRVESDGFCLARVGLKAQGPMETKLAVFSIREWAVDSVTPAVESTDYTLTLPASFSVQVNGTALSAADGEALENRQVKYTLSGLYLKPDLSISDSEGNQAQYVLKKDRIMVEYYDYSLTLPVSLTVQVNGTVKSGEGIGAGMVRYDISGLTKPTVEISDYYGNTVEYGGGSQLPLTAATVTLHNNCALTVMGQAVPEQALLTSKVNPDYVNFAEYVDGLPLLCQYSIAVLRENADITVTDPSGTRITLSEETGYDLTELPGLDTVPDSVASQVDVLTIAQNWSKFLTRDLKFSGIKESLISTSYQYEVALSYANGPDIGYTSRHTLANPPFRDNSVTNFVWIADNCFSVDISFVKQMILYYGARVDDPMNDRFYFVKYDDTADGVDNPIWMLAGMKEIVDNDTDE